jgi:hypothetical protein
MTLKRLGFLITVTPDAAPRRQPNFVVLSDWRTLVGTSK